MDPVRILRSSVFSVTVSRLLLAVAGHLVTLSAVAGPPTLPKYLLSSSSDWTSFGCTKASDVAGDGLSFFGIGAQTRWFEPTSSLQTVGLSSQTKTYFDTDERRFRCFCTEFAFIL